MALPKEDLVYLHVKAGMTVGVTEIEGDWWMADVVQVECALNRSVPSSFQVAEVGSGFITWINADLVTHIVPRL